jgi:hypothetical protein
MDYLDLFCFITVLAGLAAGLTGWLSLRWRCRHLPETPAHRLDGSIR